MDRCQTTNNGTGKFRWFLLVDGERGRQLRRCRSVPRDKYRNMLNILKCDVSPDAVCYAVDRVVATSKEVRGYQTRASTGNSPGGGYG